MHIGHAGLYCMDLIMDLFRHYGHIWRGPEPEPEILNIRFKKIKPACSLDRISVDGMKGRNGKGTL